MQLKTKEVYITCSSFTPKKGQILPTFQETRVREVSINSLEKVKYLCYKYTTDLDTDDVVYKRDYIKIK